MAQRVTAPPIIEAVEKAKWGYPGSTRAWRGFEVEGVPGGILLVDVYESGHWSVAQGTDVKAAGFASSGMRAGMKAARAAALAFVVGE